MEKIKLKISGEPKSYEIGFPGSFSALTTDLKTQINNRSYLIVTDENVWAKSPFFETFGASVENVLVLPAGEAHKTWGTIEKILTKAFDLNLDREAVFIAAGGGVYGDLVGFAASIFMRGIPFIQVPTSLLAMVDSSVGGKTGFDTIFGKNLVGSFHQPEAVFCCTEFLKTLPEGEIKNGLCEMIKHGVLAAESHFKHLEMFAQKFALPESLEALRPLICESIKIKKKVVELDEKESGVRGHLNLGHTFGHAIEQLSHFKIPHGQAVAMGTVMAVNYAADKGICDFDLADRIENIFHLLEIDLMCDFSEEAIFGAMMHDKKKKDGKIRLILPIEMGKVDYFDLD